MDENVELGHIEGKVFPDENDPNEFTYQIIAEGVYIDNTNSQHFHLPKEEAIEEMTSVFTDLLMKLDRKSWKIKSKLSDKKTHRKYLLQRSIN